MKMKSFKTFTEKAKDVSDKEYEKLFNNLLKKYKVKDLGDLDKKKTKEFFKTLDKMVKSDEGK